MGRRYKNNSIIEALCEFRFKSDSPWDAIVYGQFYEKVKDEYSQREQLQDVEATIGQGEGGEVIQGLRRSPRMRFLNEDNNRLVQVGERLLVVNVLRPYPHWEKFKPIILETLEKWNEAVESPPPSLEQVTLRYIDRFEHRAEGFKLGDWINCGDEYFPKVLKKQSSRATCQTRHEVSGDDRFSTSLKLWPSDDGTKRVVTLDTEFVTGRITDASSQELEPELDRMHDKIYEAFESSITDQTREQMNTEQGSPA